MNYMEIKSIFTTARIWTKQTEIINTFQQRWKEDKIKEGYAHCMPLTLQFITMTHHINIGLKLHCLAIDFVYENS